MSQELNPNIQEIRDLLGVISESAPKTKVVSDGADLNALRIKIIAEKIISEVKGLY